MYVPSHFKEDDIGKLQQYIRDYGFGLLVVADEGGIEANHVPFHLISENDGSLGQLQCHLARSNPVWQRLYNGVRVLVVFQGPDAYVSPSWYETKAETGRVVPTWNYLAVHAEGTARVVEDSTWLTHHLHRLTDQHESGMDSPWSVKGSFKLRFNVKDLEEALAEIRAWGIDADITENPWGRTINISDPDGNRVGVRDEAGFVRQIHARKTA